MAKRDKANDRSDALNSLARCRIPVGTNFFTLDSEAVTALLVEADRVRYRKPRNANGSRGRYFHERLQRLARAES